MINFLAFDIKTISLLLNETNQKYFSYEFPIFYKGSDKYSAIDVALERNQIRSVNMMVKYIVKHQNTHVYFNLFQDNFVQMAQKGVILRPLIESEVFNYQFDFDQWPGTNANI